MRISLHYHHEDMLGREVEWGRLEDFVTGGADAATLAVVWGRAR
jgi:hypothetical protein